jgi:hypothetical protein
LNRALEAPVEGVVNLLTVGDLLRAVLSEGPPEVVAIVSDAGSIAGSVVPTSRLVECLKQGVEFVVRVVTIDGGAIMLEIRAVA